MDLTLYSDEEELRLRGWREPKGTRLGEQIVLIELVDSIDRYFKTLSEFESL
jgi:hypothetical protein